MFTLIVQNSVPVEQLGTATSNLTFFQQVGGTVGLAITGTIFATALAEEVPRQLAAADVPPELGGCAGRRRVRPDALTGVGDLGAAILAGVPEAAPAPRSSRSSRPSSTRSTRRSRSRRRTRSCIGIGASLLAAALVAMLKEVPMRHEAPAPGSAPVATARAVGEPGA